MTANGTRFSNPKLIADKTGWAVGVIKDEQGLTHFMIIDPAKEAQP